ncbi:MAG: hypothetical protein JO159_11125 [Acidobacteria bacterium]|nr:hypothetical protein [Acidobacteriota bacterium]MBV9622556.1 hypothetical protein [Acidobacteriota bacterium]
MAESSTDFHGKKSYYKRRVTDPIVRHLLVPAILLQKRAICNSLQNTILVFSR